MTSAAFQQAFTVRNAAIAFVFTRNAFSYIRIHYPVLGSASTLCGAALHARQSLVRRHVHRSNIPRARLAALGHWVAPKHNLRIDFD